MLKAKSLAYDGRGNYPIKSIDEVESAFEALTANQATDAAPISVYAEQWCNFECELAVMVVRGKEGSKTYSCVQTIQRNSVCNVVIAPCPISEEMRREAEIIALAAIDCLPDGARDLSEEQSKQQCPNWGVFGVELFLETTEQGKKILLNEIAPRPHNSGHFTMDACETSQFEQHLRAVTGMELGSTQMHVEAAIMVNIFGSSATDESDSQHPISLARASRSIPGARLHWYAKQGNRAGRKMGHINIVGNSWNDLIRRVSLAQHPQLTLQALGLEFPMQKPVEVGVIMGSDSDLPTIIDAVNILSSFAVSYELTIVSAHRTPERMFEYAKSARSRGLKVCFPIPYITIIS